MVNVARWYVVSYRHPGSGWIDYGEPVPGASDDVILRLLKQLPAFTELRVKVLDVKEPQ